MALQRWGGGVLSCFAGVLRWTADSPFRWLRGSLTVASTRNEVAVLADGLFLLFGAHFKASGFSLWPVQEKVSPVDGKKGGLV